MAATATLAPDGTAGTTRPDPKSYTSLNGRRAVVGTLTLSGTYTNPGGDVLPLALTPFSPNRIDQVVFTDSVTSGGLVPQFNPATGKLSLFKTGSSTGNPLQEVANGAAVSDTIRVIVAGH
jgi:hypothetical protein